MVGIGGAVAIAAVVAVGAAVAAGVAAHSAMEAAEANAEAQKYVAEQNAKATVEAARLAADAQKTSAEYDMKARIHESDVAFNQEMEYLKQEKWLAEREDDANSFYDKAQTEIDAIDYYYGGEGSWGMGEESAYDYGGDGYETYG